MSTQPLDLRSVNSLLNEAFFIPKYQRGYRWTSQQVIELLDDIKEFNERVKSEKNSALFYCLQPLVVTKNDEKWEVVDGQQRLTTIHLILTYLNDIRNILGIDQYSLSYATRTDSEAFLKQIDATKATENIDYYHIVNAYKAIEDWFADKKGAFRTHFLNTLTQDDEDGGNVKFIWYEIPKMEAVDVFTRINMGKIPLTNAELIKALFLKDSNFEIDEREKHRLYQKQLEIATEWDNIENTLQQSSFWYFIHDNNRNYDTRIEFIFDLIKNKQNKNRENFTFIAYLDDLKTRKISEVWLEIKQYFMRLEEWYNDHELYHLIGYLITTGSKVNDLLKAAKTKSKSDFLEHLKTLISEKMSDIELEEVNYSYGSTTLRHILLLFNIETILQNPKSNIRFPFDDFKTEKWDIEHISSVMSEMPTQSKRQNWLEKVDEYFNGSTVLDFHQESTTEIEAIKQSVKDILSKEDFSEDSFKPVYERIINHFKESSFKENDDFTHSLGNLTLLDEHTNRSYKNAIFPVKRKRILENDKNGYFIPICTKNVFLKYYSEQFSDALFWQKSDAMSYLKAIETVLSPYFSTSNA